MVQPRVYTEKCNLPKRIKVNFIGYERAFIYCVLYEYWSNARILIFMYSSRDLYGVVYRP